PEFYKSAVIAKIKEKRKLEDPKKKDFSPTLLDLGSIRFYIARHFGFCYGVENAIETAFKAIEENPDKKIFLLSQMIHNPEVNKDLTERGVQFIMDTSGAQIIPWENLQPNDIAIIPAFGTTLEIESKLKTIGLELQKYNTTCPFVERVWKKSEKLGQENYTIIIHGKHNHEETRATFSHSEINSPCIIIKNMEEAKKLADFILKKINLETFNLFFQNRYSANFDPEKELEKIGVINQTTMLATETQEIADFLKKTMIEKYGIEELKNHFADTRDTLCYATNENQEATYQLLKKEADLAIVVGGYNSSNTSHIVELCEQKLPTYFISSADEIISNEKIKHYNYHKREQLSTENYLPNKNPITILLTSGASCPDAVIEKVLKKLTSFFENEKILENALDKL
ncbi:MAG TPA: 4-hydroxy-3-methylbut-2-enyl diphosphate reductase, partial [Bacteroidia bacterium]|nr:4-hydroxy-3-methylbut-2-enyl diphosphate reductase [Bacteroidia bacterium]